MSRIIELEFDEGMSPLEAWQRGAHILGDALGVGALAKAVVPAHPSQFQARGGGGQFAARGPHHHTPRDASGRFRQRLSREEGKLAADRAVRLITEQLAPRLHEHLEDFQQGAIQVDQWRTRCARDLQFFYEEVYRAGKQTVGDPAVKLTPQDKALLNRLVKDELHYLDGFAGDLDTGTFRRFTPQQRMQMYAGAATEAYWNGWVMGDLRAAREIHWKLGEAEHCKDCLRFSERGWLPIITFVTDILSKGYAPRSGQLECKGLQCRCRLIERLNGQESEPVLA